MVRSFTSTPREARWLGQRLRSLTPPLPVHRSTGQGEGRHIVYFRSGGTDISNLSGTYVVRSSWTIYISQPVEEGMRVYVEDLEADADRMNEAIYRPEVPGAVNGRYIEDCRRDVEHSLEVYDEEANLVEIQLGGIYVLLTSLA